ncbi:MAG: methylenetetrahydrofolate reductase C-terminal domain-containing protein [Sedimentisphaerales bacterium]|nr:methylenetetrahydrofolate reductase C-terminal domain-containing protein [Sedimentisphaerales bacterium]
MIFAEWKPLDELIEKLKIHKRVLLVGCATCVAECSAGGEKEVETLAPLLRMALTKQGHSIEIITDTLEKQCEWEFVEQLAEKAATVDAIMSIACGIGVQALAERFDPLPVYPGVNTSALTIREEAGLWAARCAACGDCVLGETFGFCPIARCAKSLLNGPCGGTRSNGKCEIDENIDCVWNLIIERADKRGQLAALSKIQKTKDWSNSRHGGPKRVIREDLRQ